MQYLAVNLATASARTMKLEGAQLALLHDAVLCGDPPPRRQRQNLRLQPRGAPCAKWQDDHSSRQAAARVQGTARERRNADRGERRRA
eukprot:3476026-Prymnesium_polylepis.1